MIGFPLPYPVGRAAELHSDLGSTWLATTPLAARMVRENAPHSRPLRAVWLAIWRPTGPLVCFWGPAEAGAVKSNPSVSRWDGAALAQKRAQVRRRLDLLSGTPCGLRPGRYLTPAALKEILDLVSGGDFRLKDHRTAQTPLIQMVREDRRLDPRVALREHHAGGLAPLGGRAAVDLVIPPGMGAGSQTETRTQRV